jgi:hypothetical protein
VCHSCSLMPKLGVMSRTEAPHHLRRTRSLPTSRLYVSNDLRTFSAHWDPYRQSLSTSCKSEQGSLRSPNRAGTHCAEEERLRHAGYTSGGSSPISPARSHLTYISVATWRGDRLRAFLCPICLCGPGCLLGICRMNASVLPT